MSDQMDIKPYDLSGIKNLYDGYLDTALKWWRDMDQARLEKMSPKERKREMWLRSRRDYWRPIQYRLADERVARVKEFIGTLNPRHWESFEQSLHGDCY